MIALVLSVFLMCNESVALSNNNSGAKMGQDKTEISTEAMYKLVQFFNKTKKFPIGLDVVAKETGLPLTTIFGSGATSYRGSHFSINLRLIKIEEITEIHQVEISGKQTLVSAPENPPGEKFRESTYAYLPFYRVAGPLGENLYRSLYSIDLDEHKKVTGTDGFTNPPEWIYRIDSERGPYISEQEKQESKNQVLGLMKAIKENRFEAYYEEFKVKFPKDKISGHKFATDSLTIMYFNDNKESEYYGKHLEEKGLSEYVGLHFNRIVGFKGSFPRPYLFDFFGIEQIDAARKSEARPYAGLTDRKGVPHGPAIEEDIAISLPDIKAAGNRFGGLAYYNEVKYIADGWNLWMPGFYPHDGKTVERFVNKDKYRVQSFEVLYSRKK